MRPLGIEDEDVGARQSLHAVDRGGARVARRRADDGDPLALLRQHVLEQPADELQRNVLEGQRRPVEQLLHEVVVADLHERDDGGMSEAAIGRDAHRRQVVDRYVVSDERLHDLGSALPRRSCRRRVRRQRATLPARTDRHRLPARRAALR